MKRIHNTIPIISPYISLRIYGQQMLALSNQSSGIMESSSMGEEKRNMDLLHWKTQNEIYLRIEKANDFPLFVQHSKDLLYTNFIVLPKFALSKRPNEKVASNSGKEIRGPNLLVSKHHASWISKYGGKIIPAIHYKLLDHFVDTIPHLASDYDFLVLKMQLLAQKQDVPVEYLEDIFHLILSIPALNEGKIQRAFNTMLSVYKMKEVNTQKIMNCVHVLKESFNFSPDLRNSTVILSSLYSFRLIEDCLKYYKSILERIDNGACGDLKIDCRIGSIMIRVYAFLQGPKGAKRYMDGFQKISSDAPDVYMWTSLIRAFSYSTTPESMITAESLFMEMLSKGILPDESAYCSVIGGYVQRRKLDLALDWIKQMIDAGVKPDHSTYNILQECVLNHPESQIADWYNKVFSGRSSLKFGQIKRRLKTPLDNDVARTSVIDRFLSHRVDRSLDRKKEKEKLKVVKMVEEKAVALKIAKDMARQMTNTNYNPSVFEKRAELRGRHVTKPMNMNMIETVPDVLNMSEGIATNPVSISTIATKFFKTEHGLSNLKELFSLLNMPSDPLSSNSQIAISLFLLAEYKKSATSCNVILFFQEMIDAKMPMTDTIYKNLILVAVKFNEIDLGQRVVDRLTKHRDADFPIPNGMMDAFISIICLHKRGNLLSASNIALTRLVPFSAASEYFPSVQPLQFYFQSLPIPVKKDSDVDLWMLNRINGAPMLENTLYNTPYISLNRHWTRLGIQIIQDRLEKKQEVFEKVWLNVCQDAFSCDDAEVFALQLYGLMQRHVRPADRLNSRKLKSRNPEIVNFYDVCKIFYMTMFQSHQWRVVLFFLKLEQNRISPLPYLIKHWLPSRAKKRDSGGIFTAFFHLYPRNLEKNGLVTSFINSMKTCKSEMGLEAIWKLICSFNKVTQPVFFAYLEAAVALKMFDAALHVCTTGSPSWMSLSCEKNSRDISDENLSRITILFKQAQPETMAASLIKNLNAYWTLQVTECD